MSRCKLGLLGILAAFALVAANASVAAAADVNVNFEVEDKEVPAGGEKLSPTVVVNKAFILKNSVATIECPSLKVAGGKIEPAGKNAAASLEFSGCKVTSAEATCDVEKGEINTKPVTSQAEGEPEPLLDRFADAEIKFSPTTPPEFVGIKIVNKPGKTCLLAKTLKVTGATACDVATLAEADAEQENHKLVCVAVTGGVEESTLELAAKPAEFSGEATIKLESKKVWSLAEGS